MSKGSIYPGRAAGRVTMTVAADAEGRLQSVRAALVVDGGGYGSLVPGALSHAVAHMAGPYAAPHLSLSADVVRTHNLPAGVMRDLGGCPGAGAGALHGPPG